MSKTKKKIKNCIFKNRRIEAKLADFLHSSYNMSFREFWSDVTPTLMEFPLCISGSLKSLYIQDNLGNACILQLHATGIVVKYSISELDATIYLKYVDEEFQVSYLDIFLPYDNYAELFIDLDALCVTICSNHNKMYLISEDLELSDILMLCFLIINKYQENDGFQISLIKDLINNIYDDLDFVIV